MLQEPLSEDDAESETSGSCADDEDYVEVRQCDSQTEQEISSEEETSDDIREDVATHYVGKDKVSKWRKTKPVTNVRTRAHNIISHLPGVKGSAKEAKSPLDCWKSQITNDMLELIVTNTNKYITTIKEHYYRERDAKETTLIEVKALIGLLYLAGFLRSGRQNIYDLWATDGTGVEIFRKVMPLSRFKFLLQCIRFDDKGTRNERLEIDRLSAVRELFDMFLRNCQVAYTISEYATIDEKLEAFRGRCIFRQYIPSKPNKYGIKIFAMVDARTFYTCNLEVYVGNQPDGPYKFSNSPGDVVERLSAPVSGTGRNITIDNWFTSCELAEKMLTKHKLTIVGTLRKNKRQIPPEFVSTKGRELNSSLFGFQEKCTLVSYVPKKGKNVLLISTLHNDDKIDHDSGDLQKPEIITFYNLTKGGVDVVDEMGATYSCARKTRRWPMVIFYSILNVAGINALVIYCGNNNPKMTRREFIKNFAIELTTEYTNSRTISKNVPRQIKDCANRKDPQTEIPQKGKRGRCQECKGKDRKTQYYCEKCFKFLCMEHFCILCQECSRNESE